MPVVVDLDEDKVSFSIQRIRCLVVRDLLETCLGAAPAVRCWRSVFLVRAAYIFRGQKKEHENLASMNPAIGLATQVVMCSGAGRSHHRCDLEERRKEY